MLLMHTSELQSLTKTILISRLVFNYYEINKLVEYRFNLVRLFLKMFILRHIKLVAQSAHQVHSGGIQELRHQ